MKYCSECGFSLKKGSKYCTNCGKSIDSKKRANATNNREKVISVHPLLIITLIFVSFLTLIIILMNYSYNNRWKQIFEISEVEIKDNYYSSEYIVTVKNKDDKKHEINVYFESKNGSIKEDGWCLFEELEAGETKTLTCIATGGVNSSYKAKVKNISIKY